MGSRAVVVVCKDAEAAQRRFGVLGGESGIIYTRTGRRFFENEPAAEAAVLDRVRAALSKAGFWEEFQTDWFCLDCELMPWSAKAQALLVKQYAPVRAAGEASLAAEAALLGQAATRLGNADLKVQADKTLERAELLKLYGEAYRRYCWTVSSVDDYKLAPFHLLASEGKVHTDKDHRWHMETLARLCNQGDALLLATPLKVVDLADAAQCDDGLNWWKELTGKGGEGMVVKPLSFILRGKKGLAQPAVKCRGREYLRIIYGPEYTLDVHLTRLRSRGLGAKRALAINEFSLGLEALERFVRREPLRKVHECVFGVLAMESEPVDPRL
jgi:protein phosphatase